MFSFLNTSVEIEGLHQLNQDMSGYLNLGQSQVSEFSALIRDLNSGKPDLNLSDLSRALTQLLEKAGLNTDKAGHFHLQSLNGKTLPPAAENALKTLEQLVLEPGNVPDVDSVLEQLQLLSENLPAEYKKPLEHLNSLISEYLQKDNTQVEPEALPSEDKLAIENDIDTPVTHNAKAETDKPTVDTEVEYRTDEQAVPVINVAETINPGREKVEIKPDNKMQQPLPTPAANVQSSLGKQANLQADPTTEIEHDAEVQLDVEKVIVNTKNHSGPSATVATARINPLLLSSQAIASHSSSSHGGEGSHAGAGNNAGNGSNLTQLLSQAVPSPITQNIHKPEWGNAVGQRIQWMVGNRLQAAQLRITPAHLGPVEMKISIEKNQAQVTFVNQHQVVRDALDNAVPRLREMLEEQGLDLVNVDIRDQTFSETAQSSQDEMSQQGGSQVRNEVPGDEQGEPEVTQQTRVSSALLDMYV